MQSGPTQEEQIKHGRFLMVSHACGDCHGGGNDPSAFGWLDGARSQVLDQQFFKIGPFTTYAKNLTPDNATGTGRLSERQIFNALRYGLRPEETPDVEITSTVPGQGNFPLHPHYLAPPMPWPSWRHMPDDDLRAIAAYIKNGVKPVSHKVPDSEGPPDFWASEYTVEKIGPYPAKPYPTANETRR
jgi:mono/diheme cytochrome c family protein